MIKAAYQFLEYLRGVKNASEHTIRNYAIDLNALKHFLENTVVKCPPEKIPEKISYTLAYEERNSENDALLTLSQIDRKLLRRFLAALAEANTHKRTVVRKLSSLRTFFKFCVRQNLIPKSPAEDLESPKLDKRIPLSLTYAQVQRLFDQPHTERLSGISGSVHYGTFLQLRPQCQRTRGTQSSDFDPHALLVKLKGKGKKERIVPITKNAADWISSLSRPS